MNSIITGISANGIMRSFSILGGEPLAPQNLELTKTVISKVRQEYPDILIYLWTGYTYKELLLTKDEDLLYILNQIDCLIDNPFILAERDITLYLRGSRNQHIYKNPHTSSILSYQRID